MRRLNAAAAVLGLAFCLPVAFAQEGKEAESKAAESKGGEHGAAAQHGAAESHEKKEDETLEIWKWANFAILAGGLGYVIGKNAGPFFSERTRQIRKEITQSEEARRQAEARAAAVEQRLASLESEIASLRADAQKESEIESQRLKESTAAEIAKRRQHAEQEIASAGKAARLELKRYSAQLALDLAERKVRDRMTPAVQDGLVQGFVRNLQ